MVLANIQRNKLKFEKIRMDQYIELKELFEASRNDENVIKMTACMKNKFLFYDLSNFLENIGK